MPRFTLILVRHAEAAIEASTDHGRELTASGHNQASAVGQTLASLVGACDVAIVSSAVRARQTFMEVSKYLTARSVAIEPELYSANSEMEFSNIIKAHSNDEAKVIVVVGHNPIISVCASVYSGSGYQFAPAEFVILKQESTAWDVALNSDGCWE